MDNVPCVCEPTHTHMPGPTLIAVPHGVKVHVVLVVGEEEEAEPGVEGVDGDDEEDAHNVPLLIGCAVETQVHVDLERARGTVSGRLRSR